MMKKKYFEAEYRKILNYNDFSFLECWTESLKKINDFLNVISIEMNLVTKLILFRIKKKIKKINKTIKNMFPITSAHSFVAYLQ